MRAAPCESIDDDVTPAGTIRASPDSSLASSSASPRIRLTAKQTSSPPVLSQTSEPEAWPHLGPALQAERRRWRPPPGAFNEERWGARPPPPRHSTPGPASYSPHLCTYLSTRSGTFYRCRFQMQVARTTSPYPQAPTQILGTLHRLRSLVVWQMERGGPRPLPWPVRRRADGERDGWPGHSLAILGSWTYVQATRLGHKVPNPPVDKHERRQCEWPAHTACRARHDLAIRHRAARLCLQHCEASTAKS